MPFLRRPQQKHSVAIAMTGVTLGDRLLQVGCTDASLLGAIGSKVGLSGRVCAIVPDASQAARARRAAEKSGFLLELETGDLGHFPFEDGAFNLIVVDNQEGLLASLRPEQRVATLQQAFRTLASRGRIVVIERGKRGGLGSLFGSPASAPVDPHYTSSGGARVALEAEGFRAARLLAERDGVSFYEGVR
ncbi:MAG TPA: methyltransferase domain-containing protein [Vicinamibacterales bacterium]